MCTIVCAGLNHESAQALYRPRALLQSQAQAPAPASVLTLQTGSGDIQVCSMTSRHVDVLT